MALSSADRKNLSKKYVTIPDENAGFQTNINNLNALIVDLQSKDASFKGLFDKDNGIVNLYHPEIDKLAGHIRPAIVEQDFEDSANKIKGNYFFPADETQLIPIYAPDGFWKQLKAFAGNKAVGKGYTGSYVTQDSETTIINNIVSKCNYIQSTYSQTERQTGVPTVPPVPPATFDLPLDLAALKTLVDQWESWLNSEKTALQNNTDTQESTNIATALQKVNDSLSVISNWKALPDYAVGGKVDNSGLALLTNEATIRLPFIITRIGQIDTRLGTIVQNVDGTISSFSGLYGNRYINIDSRLNLGEGTLSKQKGLELAKRVQNENITNNNNYLNYLNNNVLKASKLTANGSGTNTITVTDGTLFSVTNTIYIISETQTELTGIINNINGNTIVLSFIVPITYTITDLTRLVKEV